MATTLEHNKSILGWFRKKSVTGGRGVGRKAGVGITILCGRSQEMVSKSGSFLLSYKMEKISGNKCLLNEIFHYLNKCEWIKLVWIVNK